MRVFNQDKTIELKDYDLTLGKLQEDTLITHIEAVLPVEEKGHYETIREYEKGGKDVEWVVDVAGVKGVEAHDEVEQIMVYIPYTEQEITKINNEKRIYELKQLLKDSDYRAIKYAEGLYTEEEYLPYKEQRQAYRDEINALEQELED